MNTPPRRTGHDGAAANLLPVYDLFAPRRPALSLFAIPELWPPANTAAHADLVDAVTDLHAHTWADIARGQFLPKTD